MMKLSTLLARLLSGAVAVVIGVGLIPATYAAELEEIIVTAQKREQDVQNVPIAITAVTGEMMETRGITNVSQVADYAPNVYMDGTVAFSGSNSVLAAYIRGIGQGDFAFNLEPGVGVYVDGVYMARTIGANADLLDVERLEVLKGPQGTLFGRNTIGGAINVVTRRPGDEFSWRGELTTGSYDRVDIRGAVETPIIDETLYGSVAFSSKNRAGYQRRIPFGTNNIALDNYEQFVQSDYQTHDEAGGENQDNIRAKLLWVVNDDLEITLTGDYNKTDEQGTPNTELAIVDGTGSLDDLHDLCVNTPPVVLNTIINTNFDASTGANFLDPAGNPLPNRFGFNTTDGLCGPRGITAAYPHAGAPTWSQTAIGGVNVDADPNNDRLLYGAQFLTDDIDETYATGNNFNKLDMYGISGQVDYDLANDWHIKYIGSWRHLLSLFGFDFDGSPLVVLEPSFDTKQEQYSNEIQLSGLSYDDRWEWVLGFYQFHEEGDLTDYPAIGNGGMLQIFGQNFFDNDAWAVFTHNHFKVTEQLGVTFGLRYTDESKDFEGQQRDLNNLANKLGPTGSLGFFDLDGDGVFDAGSDVQVFPDLNDLTRYYPLGTNHKSFTDLTITGGLDYHFTEDLMFYFSYAEGFKSGGWTTRLSQPQLSTVAGTNPNDVGLEFDEETATTYEVGMKSEWLDNSLLLNLAGFFSQYDDIQVTQQIGASPVFRNGGDGEITGFEAEATWLATDRLTLIGSLGWMDADYTKIAPGVNDAFGNPLPLDSKWVNVPEWDINLAGDYNFPLSSGAGLGFHIDWSHTSSIANDFGNTPELIEGSADFVNLSATYTNPSDKWDLSIGGRNITDKRILTVGQNQPATGSIQGAYNRPAEWFLTLRVRN